MLKSYSILISGQVQGVGFRPYVYNLAERFKLKGSVSNNAKGVEIFVTGKENEISQFYQDLIENPPPVSKIESHSLTEIPTVHFKDFSIAPSTKDGSINLRLTPDFALCEKCKEDLLNPQNRRYQYAFTTCIHCGPRWAITQKFPFDRHTVSMASFEMCGDCFNEYNDSTNRRFHSQTNSCETCGIQLSLWNREVTLIENYGTSFFKNIANHLEKGKIVAINNTSGYLLCCHAEYPETIQKLRALKKRPKKPFAVLYPSITKLEKELPLNLEHRKSFESSERPIVILPLKNYRGKIALNEVAPGLSQLGVMVPYTGILQLLAQELDFPIVATSGNIHGSPVISDTEEAFEKLHSIADYYVNHNLIIEHPQDDSVLKYSFKHQTPILFRRSRGYAPNIFVSIPKRNQRMMAMGADLKSSLTFLPNEHLYTSQYLGNLGNYDVYDRFVHEACNLMSLFNADPEVLLVDKHPAYVSSAYGKELAKSLSSSVYSIQHHKAHFASVLGEHELFDSQDKILGVIWDGTGYGDDSQIWGGEFFEYHNRQIERLTHFEYFDWIAGDKMSKEPRLSLFSLCEEETDLTDKFTVEEINIYTSLKKNNRLKTSSVGRLFDAVASLLGLCDYNTYEGEASILLENLIGAYDIQQCKSYVSRTFDGFLPSHEIIKEIKRDIENNTSNSTIAINFIYTLAKIIIDYASSHNYRVVCCSGGVFQNTTLIDMLQDLNNHQMRLCFNRKLPPNDENISFGQAMYYLYCKEL